MPVTLISAPGAASTVGAGWFDALVSTACATYPKAAVTAVLDCGDAPGRALSALRHGFKSITYYGARQNAISEIALAYGAVVLAERPAAIDLEPDMDDAASLEAACRKWLSKPES